MRSASWTSATLAGLATVPFAMLLAGCVTTQQIAARARLVDARIRASQVPLRITQRSPDAEVTGLSLIRAPAGTAVVAQVRSTSTRPLTDLPIAVGVINRTGAKRYLNRGANLAYFDSHIAAIGPRSVATWVFTTGRRIATSWRPFAEVGVTQLAEPATTALPPVTVASARGTSAAGVRSLHLVVTNGSAIPQYGLQVYAVAVRAGKILAAGSNTVTHLGSNGRESVQLALLGRTGWSAIRLSAVPTIFR